MNLNSVGKVALELFCIVLGVLLALGLNEWQSQRNAQQLAATALANVLDEIEENQSVLESIHANNSETVEIALAAADDEEEAETRNFIPGVQLRANAWDALNVSAVSTNIDYDDLLLLSEAYHMQSVYRETGMKLVEISMSLSAMATVNEAEVDPRLFRDRFMPHFQMLLGIEDSLLGAYEQVLADVDRPPSD